jgi:putative transposase
LIWRAKYKPEAVDPWLTDLLSRKPARLVDLTGSFCTKRFDRIGLERSLDMPKKRPTPEQIVTLLRQIEVTTSQGKSVSIACREAGISDQSYYRWRKEYGGLDLDQARRMKDLEKENSRLKRLVADLSLEKQVLKDIASGNL